MQKQHQVIEYNYFYLIKQKFIKNVLIACGFNVEKFEYKNLSFTAYDVGGQKNIRYYIY